MELPLGSGRGDCSFEALKGASSGPLAQPPYPLLKAAWVLFTQDQSGSDRWQILVAGTCSMHVCVSWTMAGSPDSQEARPAQAWVTGDPG